MYTRTNLPSQLTSFIGRENEIREVKEALSKHRLVNLTGPGGIGKTRMSLQVATSLRDEFPDGVWFFELELLSEPYLIQQMIKNALGLVEQKDMTTLQMLQEHFKEKKSLLILDNCEHLIEACAVLSNELLKHTEHLKILATSREELRVQGEFVWRVPSLYIPDIRGMPEIAQVVQSESVRLFIERAQLVHPKFELNTINVHMIVQICFRLDGIPLAIELAAARLKTLSIEQISTYLDDRFNLLTNGARTISPRHQTLWATLDWSYNLLSEEEKKLFCRLAVFPSSWTLDAAEVICDGDGIRKEQVMDLITSLAQKSLLNAENLPGGVRYHSLETIRQYGREKFLVGAEVEDIRMRFLRYYVELAERVEPELHDSDQIRWFDQLELEVDNLRSALGLAAKRDTESFLKLASSLWLFFRTLEYKKEGIEWLIKAVEANRSLQTHLLSTAMARLSYLCVYLFVNQKQAEEYAHAALALSRQTGDKFAEALASISMAEIALERMDGNLGGSHVGLALEIARDIKDHWLISTALLQKGKFDQAKNRMEGMLTFEESLKEARLSGDKRLISASLFWILVNLIANGNLIRAKEVARQRLEITKEIGDKDGVIYSLNALASIALYEEDYLSSEEHAKTVIQLAGIYNHDSGLLHGLGSASLAHLALRNFSQALELITEMERLILAKGKHLKVDAGYHLFLRAWVYILGDNIEYARNISMELLQTYQQVDNMLLNIECLRVFAAVAFIRGDYEKHVVLASIVSKLRAQVAMSFFDYPFMTRIREEQNIASRKALSEEVFNRAWMVGQTLTLDHAKEYAMDLLHA
ncbi:MAG: NB-ARC domain-containing protein [Anaerolineales bacterium]